MTPKAIFRYYPHCSAQKSTGKKRQDPPHSRFLCTFLNCKSTFTRPSDLARHKKTIHGVKQKCIYAHCKYATARVDKMSEHIRNLHTAKNAHVLERSSQGTGLGCSFLEDIPPTVAARGFTKANADWSKDFTCFDLWVSSWDLSSFTGSLSGNFDGPGQSFDSTPILQDINTDLFQG